MVQWEFALEEGTDPAGVVRRVNAGRLELAGTARITRSWLDTFDWRLYDAGLLLELTETEAGSDLALTQLAGGDLVAHVATTKAPMWPTDLPSGPLRDNVAARVEMRALLPTGSTTVSRRSWRVLDKNDKTVTRIEVDEPVASRAATVRLAPRLRVRAVRGYARQTERVVLGVAQEAGVSEPEFAESLEVMLGSGRPPGGYSG